jgi:calcineurin-like phosphoesterase family protein
MDDCKVINQNNCIQHGEFLNSKEMTDLADDDVICFTDGDIILQRRMSSGEIELLRNLGDNDVLVGYNASPDDTLYNEAMRLSYTGAVVPGLTDIDLRKIKVYNTGVLTMNKKTWWSVYKKYLEYWDRVDSMFTHYAKQQWLLSLIVNTMGYNVIEMSYQMHSHGHGGTPIGCYYKDSFAMNNGKKILFRHKL